MAEETVNVRMMPGAPDANQIPQPTFNDDRLDIVEYQTVSQAYFQGIVGLGTAARARAQAGFAIVSAIAGAVVALAVSSTIANATGLSQAFTYASLAAWAATALLLFFATIMQPLTGVPDDAELEATDSFPTPPAPAGPLSDRRQATDGDRTLSLKPVGFVAYVFRLAKGDSHRVSWLTQLSAYFVIAAVVALLGAVGSLLWDPIPAAEANAIVTVNDAYFAQYEDRCEVMAADSSLRDLVGQVTVSSITGSNAYVELKPAAGACQSSQQLMIPAADIVTLEEYTCPLSDVTEMASTPDPVLPCLGKATPLTDIYHWITRTNPKPSG